VGVQVKLKSLENTCRTWALLRWWFTTKRRYIKCMHLYLYAISDRWCAAREGWLRACTCRYRDHNVISDVRQVCVTSLPSLRVVDVSHNRLSRLGNDSFPSTTQLRHLWVCPSTSPSVCLSLSVSLCVLVMGKCKSRVDFKLRSAVESLTTIRLLDLV